MTDTATKAHLICTEPEPTPKPEQPTRNEQPSLFATPAQAGAQHKTTIAKRFHSSKPEQATQPARDHPANKTDHPNTAPPEKMSLRGAEGDAAISKPKNLNGSSIPAWQPPNLDALFARLASSKFRSRFRLKNRELAYLQQKGLPTIMEHARDFITTRIAPADPPNDGKQTPFRNHPVFIAQHATATCCRSCLQKHHNIPKHTPITPTQQTHILNTIQQWLKKQIEFN
nr:DUF4186 domain-containing protein [Anaerohalosphaera lusitana]